MNWELQKFPFFMIDFLKENGEIIPLHELNNEINFEINSEKNSLFIKNLPSKNNLFRFKNIYLNFK